MDPLTVTELNTYIKSYLDSNPLFSHVFVRGEISNFKRHSSGHCYMSLKDDSSVIKAVMFKYSAASLLFEPENGMKVIVHARLSAYERDGVYQLYINEMQPDGPGALHIRFEQLKEKLEKEGLFDPSHKKRIPRIPSKIGIVTSPTGAAIQDMKNVITRRFPCVEIIIYPALVQGEGAHKTIISGLEYFKKHPVDTVIIGRGGGSIEDLWCFNEEELARAIYDFDIPIISAVGHETDYTVSDLVADLRAPTPSAAAELCVPSAEEIKKYLKTAKGRLGAGITNNFKGYAIRLENAKQSKIMRSPASVIESKILAADSLREKLISRVENIIGAKREKISSMAAALDAMSPLKVLKRGYAFAEDENSSVIDSIEKISVDSKIRLNFADGQAICSVLELKGETDG